MQNKKITDKCYLFHFFMKIRKWIFIKKGRWDTPIWTVISVFCGALLICSCQSGEKSQSNIIQFSVSEYEDVIENYTEQALEYDGLQNTIEFHATLLNSRVIEAQTLRKASMLLWEKTQYDQELSARIGKSKETTEVFVSFFTPERKNNDLARSETLWKIFLKNKDKRSEGKVEKVTLLHSEIQSLYPQHNRWSNAYVVKFPIAISEIENKGIELIITGPVGTKSVHFNPMIK
jgi:hypothetical protein